VVVTATDGTLTHLVTFTVTIGNAASFQFNVKAAAAQIVVTLSFGWSGSGAPPVGTITIAGPSGSPTLYEAGFAVYDRTTIGVLMGTGATGYQIIHRVTFTPLTPPPVSAQIWTAYVSLAGVSSYQLTIEVS
jgi:hypothetical protein